MNDNVTQTCADEGEPEVVAGLRLGNNISETPQMVGYDEERAVIERLGDVSLSRFQRPRPHDKDDSA